MAHFRVTVEITGQVSYIVEASSQKQAKELALELADDGTRFREMDVVDRSIFDCVDESAEHQ